MNFSTVQIHEHYQSTLDTDSPELVLFLIDLLTSPASGSRHGAKPFRSVCSARVAPLPTSISVAGLPITDPHCTNDTCGAFAAGFAESQKIISLLS